MMHMIKWQVFICSNPVSIFIFLLAEPTGQSQAYHSLDKIVLLHLLQFLLL